MILKQADEKLTAKLPPGEGKRRRWGLALMFLFLTFATLVVIRSMLLSAQLPARAARARHADPFHPTITTDGAPQFGPAVAALRPGEAFGWVSTYAIPQQAGLLIQASFVALADGHTVLCRRHRIPPEMRNCASPAWDFIIPPHTPPGAYRLDRALHDATPGAPPRELPPLRIRIRA